MPSDAIQIEPAGRTGDLRSIGLSLGFHVFVLVLLGLLWTTRPIGGGDEQPRRVEIVLASSDEHPEYLEQTDLQEAEHSGEDTPASLSEMLPASDAPPIDTAQMLDDAAPIDLPLPGLDSTAMARPEARPGSPREIQLTPEQQEMLAAERAAFDARRPKGPATTLSVFGSGELTGRKFVFVIDRSKSMGGQGLNVLAAAADELSRAVNSLKEFHQFQIVAYHHQTLCISRRELLNATDDAKAQVGEFIDNLAAFGGTEHEAALIMALSMNPDVVVLITDGGLPELNESQLKRISRAAHGAQIHCIQFGSGPQQDLNTFMRLLAAQNSGTYRYIDANELNK
jgi:hypothetical protein